MEVTPQPAVFAQRDPRICRPVVEVGVGITISVTVSVTVGVAITIAVGVAVSVGLGIAVGVSVTVRRLLAAAGEERKDAKDKKRPKGQSFSGMVCHLGG